MSDPVLTVGNNAETNPGVVPTYVPGLGNIGERKTIIGLGWKEWSFLIVSVVNLLATIGLTIDRLVTVITASDTSSSDFTFAILILVNSFFCLFYVVNGVFREQIYQLYIFIIAICIIVGYCIIEYSVNSEGRTTIKLVRLIVASVLAPVNIVFAVLVIKEFGWLEFRIVGASDALQQMYRETNIFFSLLVFNLEVAVSVAVLVLQNGSDISVYETSILAVGIPISIFYVFWGWYTVTRELKSGVVIFIIVGLCEPSYIIYKLVSIYIDVEKGDYTDISNDYLLYTEIAACNLAFLVIVVVYYEFYRVVKNFGKGLLERVFNSEASERTGLLAHKQRRWLKYSNTEGSTSNA